MTEDEALRRAIIADPGNLTLRLVYADWLDDHDQAEAAALFRKDPAEAVEAIRRAFDPIVTTLANTAATVAASLMTVAEAMVRAVRYAEART